MDELIQPKICRVCGGVFRRDKDFYDSRHMCKSCGVAAATKWKEENFERRQSWVANNRHTLNACTRKHRLKLREEVLNHYGGKCTCCGITQHEFLTLDHVNRDGAEHRKTFTSTLYRWLRDNNYPEGFQILCYNCNLGREKCGGVCPHKYYELQKAA